MTPAGFRAALEEIGWSRRQLAQRLECDTQLANRWAAGGAPIPPSVARWLEQLVRALERTPPPDDWRVRVLRQAAE
jgi:ribosome-binding protein aMBF1 (putative translation factor)